jgi:outer membrane receptor protein involved in Fe transport
MSGWRRRGLCASLWLVLSSGLGAQDRLAGQVQDPSGRPLPGARVTLEVDGRRSQAETDADGRFTFEGAPSAGRVLTVEARGYLAVRETVSSDVGRDVVVTVQPLAFRDEVTVAANVREEGVGESLPSVAVLTSRELAATAAPALDEALRQVPGFTLFRRLGGRWANPTTQGPTLRGLGGSGAARALVLDDGVPLNDPFGGWVHWGRVPLSSLDQVEVRRGGGSHLFGSGALAGVIQLVRPSRETRKVRVELSGGTQRTWDAAGFFRGTQRGWSIDVSSAAFTTTGYVPLSAQERGPVDRAASSRHLTEEVTMAHGWAGGTRLFGRGTMFREPRKNGTPLQTNDTEIGRLVLGLDRPAAGGGLYVRAHLSSHVYDQAFSAVATDRRSEQLTREQRVDADASGLSLRYSRRDRGRRVLGLGLDVERVQGLNVETLPTPGPGSPQATDGRQRRRGAYLDTSIPLGPVALSAGIRHDRWTNEAEQAVGEEAVPVALPSRSARSWSPHGGLFVRLGPRLALNAAAYRAFRAPTLNELYRTFRVGDVVTEANPDLDAERLSGREVGLVASLGPLSLRAQAFRLQATDTVGNVTLRAQPGLITRQRQNLGGVRSEGVEADAALRSGPFVLSAGVLGADAEVTSFSADPTLEGKDLPQVPRRQITLQARLEPSTGPRLAVQARWSTGQFDDDRNQFRLAPMRTVDVTAGVPLGRLLEVFLAAENVTNQRYEVARTPLLSLGPPRSLRLGVRFRLDAQRPPGAPVTVERH